VRRSFVSFALPERKVEVKVFDHVERLKYSVMAHELNEWKPLHPDLWESHFHDRLSPNRTPEKKYFDRFRCCAMWFEVEM
jgi:hypothetical protein